MTSPIKEPTILVPFRPFLYIVARDELGRKWANLGANLDLMGSDIVLYPSMMAEFAALERQMHDAHLNRQMMAPTLERMPLPDDDVVTIANRIVARANNRVRA
jgi:hypothetical protein